MLTSAVPSHLSELTTPVMAIGCIGKNLMFPRNRQSWQCTELIDIDAEPAFSLPHAGSWPGCCKVFFALLFLLPSLPSPSLTFFYRGSICEGDLGSRNSVRLSVCLSVRLSVTRVDCDKTKWHTAGILIPHERAITLLLRYQQWLLGDAHFPLKSALKVTHPLRKTPTSTNFRS